MKGFKHGLPVSVWREYFSLGGCGGPERECFSLGGCAGPEMPAQLLTSSSEITSFSKCVFLGGVPPFLCLLGVPFLKNLPQPFPPPPCCLNGLPPNGLLYLSCGLCGDGVHPAEEFLLVWHISVQWFFLPQLWHTIPWAGHCPWLRIFPHLPHDLFFWKDLLKALVWMRGVLVTRYRGRMSLFMLLIFMAGPLMGLGHFNHPVIGELLWFSIVNKFSNLKMYSSMVKNVSYVPLL